MNCPRILRSRHWISVPELRLQEMPARIIEAACVLVVEFRLAAKFPWRWTRRTRALRNGQSVERQLFWPQAQKAGQADGVQNLL